MLAPVALLADSLAAPSQPQVHGPDAAEVFIRGNLPKSRYRAEADLNGDGRPESFVYVMDHRYCGSAGCTLFVLSPYRNSYRVVLRSTVTGLPILLLKTSTNGWRDVGVTVVNGAKTYMARLRFNGYRYPSNPTVSPATPLKRPNGTVLIGD